MNVKLKHQKLAKALQYVSRSVSNKPNIPVLSNVLLTVNKSGLKLSSTNLEMGIDMWIPGIVENEGSVTVSAKFISDFVNASLGENVEIKLEGNQVIVTTDNSKANFNTIPSSEFPVLPESLEVPLFKIKASELIQSLDKVIFSASSDISVGKIQQSGVLFNLNQEKSEINLIALDGFRLSKRDSKVKFSEGELEDKELIIPSKALSELNKILVDLIDLDEIECYLSKNKALVIFKFEDIEFSIRLIEGPYPDFNRIMPDGYSYTFEVNKNELDSAIKVVNTFAKSNLGYKTLFDLDLENSLIKIKSVVSDVGDNESVVKVENLEGDSDLNSSYNLRYISDIVSHIKGDTIVFETKGPMAASVFKDKSDPKFIHLLMPLRRDN